MTDRTIELAVIVALALLAFATVVGGIALAWSDRSLPGEIIAIGSAAAGAVGGILSKLGQKDPQEVTGPQGGPVAVTDKGDEGGSVHWPTVAAAVLVVLIILIVI